MEPNPIQLDQETMQRAVRLARLRNCSVEQLIRSLLDELERRESGHDSLIGLMADEPELIDQVMEDVYRTRETQALRTHGNG